MKNDLQRNEMVARVQAFFKEYPSFSVVPVASEGDIVEPIQEWPVSEGAYVQALYEVCSKGVPVGRSPDRNDVPALIGKLTPFSDDQ